MQLEFEVSTILSAPPSVVYRAWLTSHTHAAMTGGGAQVSNEVGGRFEAWDGYISGQNLALEPDHVIIQSWRTIEFQESEEDSRVEIRLDNHPEGTHLTLRHTHLPAHGEQYRQGWEDHYFGPMRTYFGGKEV